MFCSNIYTMYCVPTGNQDAIEVYSPDRPYTVYTRTSAEKKLWLSKLRETIYQLLLKAGKCTRSSTLDTTQRTATFLYADGRLYTGNYTSARVRTMSCVLCMLQIPKGLYMKQLTS